MAPATPVLLGLFSIVTRIAHRFRTPQGVPIRPRAWHAKHRPTFSDALVLLRSRL